MAPEPWWMAGAIYPAIDIVAAGLLGVAVAIVYGLTTSRRPQIRSFQIALVMLAMVTSFVILAIGGSLARAFGLVGALSLVRFRSVLSSTRDTAFVFMALGAGLACGTESLVLACSGTLLVALLTWLAHLPGARARERDRSLLLSTSSIGAALPRAAELLARHFESHELVLTRSRRLGEATESVYRVRLRADADERAVVTELSLQPGVEQVELAPEDGLAR